ncbi:MAG: hypothetical protein AAGF46_04145 [Pseudomonadota bacterium]
MSHNEDMRSIWQDEAGDAGAKLWDEFPLSAAPPMERQAAERPQGPWLWAGIAASWAVVGVMVLWNLELRSDVDAAQAQAALALLSTGRSDQVLAGLQSVQTVKNHGGLTDVLLQLLQTSDDPNVQLEALELLYQRGDLSSADWNAALKNVRHHKEFIERALKAQEIEI